MHIHHVKPDLSQFDTKSAQVKSSQLNLQGTVSSLAKQGLQPCALVFTHEAVNTQIQMLRELESAFSSEGLAGTSSSLGQVKAHIHILKTLQDRDFQPLGNPSLAIPLSTQGLFGGGKRTMAPVPQAIVQALRNRIIQNQDDARLFIQEQVEGLPEESAEQRVLTIQNIREVGERAGLNRNSMALLREACDRLAAEVRGRR